MVTGRTSCGGNNLLKNNFLNVLRCLRNYFRQLVAERAASGSVANRAVKTLCSRELIIAPTSGVTFLMVPAKGHKKTVHPISPQVFF
jgi:hypothetical protein